MKNFLVLLFVVLLSSCSFLGCNVIETEKVSASEPTPIFTPTPTPTPPQEMYKETIKAGTTLKNGKKTEVDDVWKVEVQGYVTWVPKEGDVVVVRDESNIEQKVTITEIVLAQGCTCSGLEFWFHFVDSNNKERFGCVFLKIHK